MCHLLRSDLCECQIAPLLSNIYCIIVHSQIQHTDSAIYHLILNWSRFFFSRFGGDAHYLEKWMLVC